MNPKKEQKFNFKNNFELNKISNNNHIATRSLEEKDHGHMLTFISFIFMGIIILLPWNVFISPIYQDFFSTLFNNVSNSTNLSFIDKGEAELKKNYGFYIGNMGQLINVLMSLLNVFLFRKKKSFSHTLIEQSILINAIIFLFHIIIVCLRLHQLTFDSFVVITISIFILNLVSCILNSSLFYLASFFPSTYFDAVIIGNNLSGIIITLLGMLSKLMYSQNILLGILIYIATVFILLFLSMILFQLAKDSKFFKICLVKYKNK